MGISSLTDNVHTDFMLNRECLVSFNVSPPNSLTISFTRYLETVASKTLICLQFRGHYGVFMVYVSDWLRLENFKSFIAAYVPLNQRTYKSNQQTSTA